ncbi:MAG: hypothetical protein U5R30_01860 [Deltaproteobacteria bacterium]|nr:hypothetical protein [Deltaproteobacteria bacterium]
MLRAETVLPQPGFPDEADGFLAADLETHVVHGFGHTVFGAVEVDIQVLDGKQGSLCPLVR